jgi:CubicO group peptidase (beta-lactamase class C family)
MQAIPELPSVAMVVVKDDKPIFMRAYGLANKEEGTKANVNTLYYIASSTKSYMALAAALLDREGKIKLSDPMTKYAPGVTVKTPIPDKVTVKTC